MPSSAAVVLLAVATLAAAAAPKELQTPRPLVLNGTTLPPCGIVAMKDDATRRAAYLQAIREYCGDFKLKTPSRTDPLIMKPQVLVNRAHKVLFVVNPKVMSTSTKLLLASFDGINITIATDSSLFTFLVSQDDRHDILEEYERVLFVRNPFTKLYSAWAEKFVHMQRACDEVRCNQGGTYWYRKAKAVIEYYNMTAPPAASGPRGVLAAISWPVFLQAVVDRVIKDRHWTPQIEETYVCGYNPTFVGALEHSNSDITALLEKLGEDPATHGVTRGNPSKRARSYDQLYPPHHHAAVVDMYVHDFEVFGYSTSLACAT